MNSKLFCIVALGCIASAYPLKCNLYTGMDPNGSKLVTPTKLCTADKVKAKPNIMTNQAGSPPCYIEQACAAATTKCILMSSVGSLMNMCMEGQMAKCPAGLTCAE